MLPVLLCLANKILLPLTSAGLGTNVKAFMNCDCEVLNGHKQRIGVRYRNFVELRRSRSDEDVREGIEQSIHIINHHKHAVTTTASPLSCMLLPPPSRE